MYIELLIITSLVLISILGFNFIFYKFSVKANKNYSENVTSITTFIEDGTYKTIKSINKVSLLFLLIISIILFVQMLTIDFLILPVILAITGFLTSLSITRFASGLLKKQSIPFFLKIDSGKSDLFKTIILNGRFVLVTILCLVIADFVIHFLVIDYLYYFDVIDLKSSISDIFLSKILSHSSEIGFMQKIHEFKIHILILLFFHFLGYVTQSIIAVIHSSYFGSVSDVAVDITSFLNYDFYEDDIRNPAILADFVGDFLKKSFKILNIISCFAVGILLTVSYFVSYFYLENSTMLSDSIFNHIISSITIFTIGVGVYLLSSIYRPTTLSTQKSLIIFSLKRFLLGVFLVGLAISAFYYFEPSLDSSNVVFVFLGMFIQIVFYLIIFFNYRMPKEDFSSIFSYIVYGVFRGASLFFILILVWVGFLVFIYFSTGSTFISCDILNLNYFLMGFFIQLFFCLGDYLGLNFIDSSAGIRKILNYDESKNDVVSFFQEYRLKLEMIIKNSFCFIGIMFVLSIMFFYYQRLLIVLHLADDSLHLDSNLLNSKVLNITNYYQVGIQNLSFDIGLILGVLFAVAILIIFVYGFYCLYQSLSNHIDNQMDDFDLIQSGKKIPDYASIVFILNKNIKKFIFSILVVVLGVPFFVSKFIGVACAIGTMFSLFFILFLIAGLGVNVGSFWSFIKLNTSFNRNENVDVDDTAVQNTNMIFCDTLGDLLKDMLGVSLIMITIGILCYFILFIPAMFNLT